MVKQIHALEKREEAVPLNAEGIDLLAELLTEVLGQAAVERKETLRLRLATEDILAVWQHNVEDGTTYRFRCGTRWGKAHIELLVPEQRVDPSEMSKSGSEALLYSNLLAQASRLFTAIRIA